MEHLFVGADGESIRLEPYVPEFLELSPQAPERIAKNWIPQIRKYLDWYENSYAPLLMRLDAVGIPANTLFDYDTLDSESVATEKKLATVSATLPEICYICSCIVEQEHNNSIFETEL